MSERLVEHIARGTISGPDGAYWNLQRDDAENIIDALLPFLTAQDVPHVAWKAWEEGRAMGLLDHTRSIVASRSIRTPNPYAEEGQ